MNILEIIQAVSTNVGLDIPTQAVSSTDREYIELVEMAREAADEIARRVDWGALRKSATITGTGTNADLPMPVDFARLTQGNAFRSATGNIRGGISPDEWFSLAPTVGTPRYFLLKGNTVAFYPFLANLATVTTSYQSKNWCSNGTANWSSDTDTPLMPSDLVMKGTLWRWKRKIRQDFSDYLGEYEAALSDLSGSDSRDRTP